MATGADGATAAALQVSGFAPLHFAVQAGVPHLGSDRKAAAAVETLLKTRGAIASLRCKWAHLTPMQYAASLGCPLVIAALAPHNCDVNAAAPELGGGTALHLGQRSEHVETVAALLAAGADPRAVDAMGRTPLACAEHALTHVDQDPLGDPEAIREIIELLKTAMAERGGRGRYPLPAPSHTLDEVVGTWQDVENRLFGGDPVIIQPDGTVLVGLPGTVGLGGGGEAERVGTLTEPAEKGLLVLEAGGNPAEFRLVNGMLIERPRTDPLSGVATAQRPRALACIGGPETASAGPGTGNSNSTLGADPLAAAAAVGRAVAESVEAAGEGTGVDTAPRRQQRSALVAPPDDAPPPLPPSGPPSDQDMDDGDPYSASPGGSALTAQHKPAEAVPEFHVGDRVLVKNKNIGLVRFKGETEFSKGEVVYGIQLGTPDGKHNGTVGTTTYFRCRPSHGVFAKPKHMKLLPPDESKARAREEAEAAARKERERLARLAANSERVRVVRRQPIERVTQPAPFSVVSTMSKDGQSHHGNKGLAAANKSYSGKFRGDAHRKSIDKKDAHRKSLDKLPLRSAGSQERLASPLARSAASASGGGQGEGGGGRAAAEPSPLARSESMASIVSASSNASSTAGRPSQHAASAIAATIASDFGLEARVMVLGVKKMGWVKFIGPTHLGDGTYIGVELSGADAAENGEHSGTVDGTKYFKCKRGHGVLVPASKVSWRGRKVSTVLKSAQR